MNRYPERDALALRGDLARYLGHGLTAGQIWAANGSNEVMLHVLQAFGGPGRQRAVLRADLLDVSRVRPGHPQCAGVTFPRRDDFTIDPVDAVAAIAEHRPDVVLLDQPQQPHGHGHRPGHRRRASPRPRRASWWSTRPTTSSPGPGRPSALELLPRYPRLAVSRTMSKAFAFAGGRLGYLAASAGLRRRAPDRPAAVPPVRGDPGRRPGGAGPRRRAARGGRPAARRARRPGGVAAARRVCEVAESDANFVLFGRFADRHAVWQGLLDRGVLIREVGPDGWLRVSAGTPERDGGVQGRPDRGAGGDPMSSAEPNGDRGTHDLGVDRRRQPRPGRHRRSPTISTGVGFYDHMLTALARHSLIDLDGAQRGRRGHRRPPHRRGHRHRARPGAPRRRWATRPASAGSVTPWCRWTRRSPRRWSTCPAGRTACTPASRRARSTR